MNANAIRFGGAMLALLTLALPARDPAAADAQAERAAKTSKTIELSGDYTMPIVLNGKTATVKVAADALKWPIYNSSLATELDLKSGPFGGTGKTEEGEKVTIRSKIIRGQYGSKKKRQRALWTNRNDFTGFDGVVGPTGIGYDVVRFKRHDPAPGERIITHPLRSFPFFGLVTATFEMEIAGERVGVDFNLDRADTLVNASTGKLLADHYGGVLSGDPVIYALFNGKNRPGRRLVLARPLSIDGLDVGNVAVRIRPEARSSIPDATIVPDPDEIVVTANKKKKPTYHMTLGTDYLRSCSSVTFDLRARSVALSCL
ncbi:hypothetical protein AB5I39_14400 [Sphingomonas sp. MMS24-J45]|uniref:hypothetical protein n=1 Tax=Sphingomonas sp. MMS24-J45 TaxID=3238806 RepID=UPI00384FBF3E